MKAKAKPKEERWTLRHGSGPGDAHSVTIIDAQGDSIASNPNLDSAGDLANWVLLASAPRLRDLLLEMVQAERDGVPPPLKAATELLKSLGVDVPHRKREVKCLNCKGVGDFREDPDSATWNQGEKPEICEVCNGTGVVVERK